MQEVNSNKISTIIQKRLSVVFIVLYIESSKNFHNISGRKAFFLESSFLLSYQIGTCNPPCFSLLSLGYQEAQSCVFFLLTRASFITTFSNTAIHLVQHSFIADFNYHISLLQIHLENSWVRNKNYILKLSPICFYLRTLKICYT